MVPFENDLLTPGPAQIRSELGFNVFSVPQPREQEGVFVPGDPAGRAVVLGQGDS